MKILLLEDDHLQAESIQRALERAFTKARVELLATECEFRARLDAIAADPPDVAVLDVMVRWANPAPEMPAPPEEVRREKFYGAGLRCAHLLVTRLPDVPVILYTILQPEDLRDEMADMPASVIHLSKQSETRPLVDMVRSLARRPSSAETLG